MKQLRSEGYSEQEIKVMLGKSRTNNQQVCITERSESKVGLTLEEMLVTSSRRIDLGD